MTTHDSQMERYRQPYDGTSDDSHAHMGSPTDNDRAISELLAKVIEARKALKLSERNLAILEQRLAGKTST